MTPVISLWVDNANAECVEIGEQVCPRARRDKDRASSGISEAPVVEELSGSEAELVPRDTALGLDELLGGLIPKIAIQRSRFAWRHDAQSAHLVPFALKVLVVALHEDGFPPLELVRLSVRSDERAFGVMLFDCDDFCSSS